MSMDRSNTARVWAAVLLLGLPSCALPQNGGEAAWRPFQAGAPAASAGGILGPAAVPAGYGGSRLTVPRVTGAMPPGPALAEEEGDVWPEQEAPRMTLWDPDDVARAVPGYQPPGRPAVAPARGGPRTIAIPPPGPGDAAELLGEGQPVARQGACAAPACAAPAQAPR